MKFIFCDTFNEYNSNGIRYTMDSELTKEQIDEAIEFISSHETIAIGKNVAIGIEKYYPYIKINYVNNILEYTEGINCLLDKEKK